MLTIAFIRCVALRVGKSSLLSGILGEMKRVGGKVQIGGGIAMCAQTAWIQNASLKDNILFGRPFDQKKYEEAIKYCALQADIDVLPAKDATEIGEKGQIRSEHTYHSSNVTSFIAADTI